MIIDELKRLIILYRDDKKIDISNIKQRLRVNFLKNLILLSSSLTTTRWKDEKYDFERKKVTIIDKVAIKHVTPDSKTNIPRLWFGLFFHVRVWFRRSKMTLRWGLFQIDVLRIEMSELNQFLRMRLGLNHPAHPAGLLSPIARELRAVTLTR
jgi:hypothetical protein